MAQEDAAAQGKAAPPEKPRTNVTVFVVLGALVVLGVALAVVFTSTGSKGAESASAAESSAAASSPKASAATIAAEKAPGAPGTAVAALPQAPPAGSSDREKAGALRRDATVQCRASQWDKCRTDLDEAKQLDPQGDDVTPIQRMRRLIAEGGSH
jgi:hypothetical protein